MTAIPLQTSVTGSGPGIVLAHGATGSIEHNFGAIIPALALAHTVVASDYPDDDTQLTLDGLADALVAAAVAADVPTFTILGFSLGAAVAVRAAVRHPDRVRALVLAAGFAEADNRARLIAQIWQDSLDRHDYDTFARISLLAGFGAEFVNNLPAGTIDESRGQIAANIPGGALQQASLVENADITADLVHVEVPTLIVNATRDLLIDPANSRELAAGIRGAEYAEIEAGHVLMLEQPEQWWATVDDFLIRHRL
ncbi:alpha/beta hydrolase [Nocardia sp. NPDC050710]|uniref:alpha/beta fold hydrolase n=1 Tax=Nocardia sp. NPDC050710 TaxID=3157220 RepID=UPI00340A5CF1